MPRGHRFSPRGQANLTRQVVFVVPDSLTLWRQYRSPFLWTLAAGVAVTAAVALAGDLGYLLEQSDLEWRYIPLILLLAPMNYILRFIKWRYFLALLGERLPLGLNLVIFLAGLGMTLTPGKAGEFLKCYLLYEARGIPSRTSGAVVLAERYTDGISMLVLTLVSSSALGFRLDTMVAILVFFLVLAGVMAVLYQGRMRDGLLHLLGRIPRLGERLQDFGQGFSDSARVILAPRPLVLSVSLGVVSWGLEGLVLYLALLALGQDAFVLGSVFTVSFAAIAGALSLLPGGLGVAEGSVFGLLLLGGYSRQIASAATLITRFSTLWLGVAVGVVGLLLAERWLQRRWLNGEEGQYAAEE